jgi:hypothetical protein
MLFFPNVVKPMEFVVVVVVVVDEGLWSHGFSKRLDGFKFLKGRDVE